jgi:Ran GTPase-activating protein (RanGAP) involved in mRNA processing and transport
LVFPPVCRLSDNVIYSEAFAALIEALKVNAQALTKLDVTNTWIGGAGAEAIAKAFEVNAPFASLTDLRCARFLMKLSDSNVP